MKIRNSIKTSSPYKHEAPFDAVAGRYDADFTATELGRRKRQIVRNYLERNIREHWRVLELNCGTGEDARWLSERTENVLATDISGGMLSVAQQKIEAAGKQNVAFLRMGIEDLWKPGSAGINDRDDTFNLVFSDFDGLNCVQDLSPLPGSLHRILEKEGHAIFVFMSGFCLVETAAHLLKGRFSDASARFRQEVRADGLQVNIGNGVSMNTWFHSTSVLLRYFRSAGFRIVAVRGVGLITPPTSMRDAYNRHLKLFRRLHGLEDLLSPLYPLNRMGDHILLHVQRID